MCKVSILASVYLEKGYIGVISRLSRWRGVAAVGSYIIEVAITEKTRTTCDHRP
jgi:hypothetical protein